RSSATQLEDRDCSREQRWAVSWELGPQWSRPPGYGGSQPTIALARSLVALADSRSLRRSQQPTSTPPLYPSWSVDLRVPACSLVLALHVDGAVPIRRVSPNQRMNLSCRPAERTDHRGDCIQSRTLAGQGLRAHNRRTPSGRSMRPVAGPAYGAHVSVNAELQAHRGTRRADSPGNARVRVPTGAATPLRRPDSACCLPLRRVDVRRRPRHRPRPQSLDPQLDSPGHADGLV